MNPSSPCPPTSRPAGSAWKVLPHVIAASLAFVAACLAAGHVHAGPITIDWVTVGDPNNAADTSPSGYGAVDESFRIMKFEFTNTQYVEFLNAVDPNGSNPFSIYNDSLGSDARGGISFTIGNAAGSKYASKANMADKPVMFVSWFDAARVANWLQNGQGSSSTETGAYTLAGGQTSGTAPARNTGAQFYIPTPDQWYKAAYYKGGSTNAGYWNYATQSDTAPTAVTSGSTGIGSAGNTGNFANFGGAADWNAQDGNATTVGTNGGPSAYGTYDMSGNLWEWNDLPLGGGPYYPIRGGSWFNTAFGVSSSATDFYTTSSESLIGFRLASPVPVPEPTAFCMALAGLACGGFSMWRRRQGRSLTAVASFGLTAALLSTYPAHAVTYTMVPVGNAGNANDVTGYGAVAYEYMIGKYEVTIGQYTEFLNAVDPDGMNPYGVYLSAMGTNGNVRGILYSSGSPRGQKYTTIGSATRPITYVSWFTAARFANWMHNGQGNGSTETGAYTLVGGATSGTAPARNANAAFSIPTDNEWYKAAFYSPLLNSGSGGYFMYATQSDTAPGNTLGTGTNQANYYVGSYPDGAYATGGGEYSFAQNYLTDVGAFTNSASYYGTFDQSGNVNEWTDLSGAAGSSRGMRGGEWSDGDGYFLSATDGYFVEDPQYSWPGVGFRLASPIAVPEPATGVMGAGGLAFAAWRARRLHRNAARQRGAQDVGLGAT